MSFDEEWFRLINGWAGQFPAMDWLHVSVLAGKQSAFPWDFGSSVLGVDKMGTKPNWLRQVLRHC